MLKNKYRKFKITYEVEAIGDTWHEAEKPVIESLKGIKGYTIKRLYKRRSDLQNDCLHQWFGEMAEILNDKGIYMDNLLRVPVRWDKETFKSRVWVPVQEVLYKTRKTRELKTNQVDKVYEYVKKAIEERTNYEVSVPFPSSILYVENKQNITNKS